VNCRAANRLYVRADGSVPCNCDIGENVTLFTPESVDGRDLNYASDCFNGPPFVELRRSFRRGDPYLDCCKNCFFFSPGEPSADCPEDGELTHIVDLQLETSFYCSIDCEACVPRRIRTDPEHSPLGAGPYHLEPRVFRKLIDDLSGADISVGEFNICGRGEPLSSPHFAELLTYARSYFPDSLYTVTTNGNARFFPGLLDLDYITFSVDGATQETYEAYRKGGSLKAAIDLMAEVVRQRRPSSEPDVHPMISEHVARLGRPVVRWKYLLFEHNDSDEEITRAQQMALEMGVDEMIFYFSHTSNRSKKYTSAEQIEQLPLFRVFDRKRSIMSNVNDEVGNVEYWERDEQKRDRR
jgi:hypothetical protein